MNKLFIYIFATLTALGCQKDDPEAQLSKLVGRWELVAREELVEGKNTWVNVSSTSFLIFREDGVVADANGLPVCCGPDSFSIDGNLVRINPNQILIKDQHCQLVKCGACKTWGIETNGNEIAISHCGRSKARYLRAD